MAINLMDLLIRVAFDSSEADKGFNETEQKATSFSQGIATAVKTFIGLRATQQVVGFAKKAVQTSMAFDSSMSQVAATMGYAADEIKTDGTEANKVFTELSNFAQEMGRTTMFSAQQAAQALNYMALAGYDSKKSMEMLPAVLNLAASGGMELARASDVVTDVQSALGLKTNETKVMIDQMAKAASSGNTSVSQLGEALLTVGATGRVVSGGTKELSMVLTTLADNGIKASEGGTKLRNILLTIQGKKFDKTFGKMGVSVYDAKGEMRSLVDILGDMNKAMGKMTSEEKSNLINNTFNRGDMAAINALLGTSVDRWGELSAAIDMASGSSEKMAGTQMNNLQGDMTIFRSAFEGLQIAVGHTLDGSLRQVVQFGTTVVSFLTEVINNPKELLGKFADEYLPASFGNILTSLTALKDTIVTGFNDALGFLKGMWELYGADIQEFVNTTFGTVLEIIGSAFGLIQQVISTALDLIKGIWKTWGETIMLYVDYYWNDIKEGISEALDVIKTIIKVATDILKGDWSSAWEGIKHIGETLWNSITRGFKEKFDLIKSVTSDVMTKVSSIIHEKLNASKHSFSEMMIFLKPILEALSVMWDTFANAVVTIWHNIRDNIKAVVDFITEFIRKNWDGIKLIVEGAVNGVKTAVSTAFGLAQNAVVTAMNVITGVINTFMALLRGDFKGALDGAKSVFTSVFDGMKNQAKTIFDGIVNAVRNAVDTLKNIMSFKWELPKLKMPHLKIDGKFSLMPPSVPTFKVDWYKKAYDSIVEFTKPTVIPSLHGLKGFGDGVGSELVMSKDMFFDAVNGQKKSDNVVINVYAQPEHDEKEIARRIAEIMADDERRREIVYA